MKITMVNEKVYVFEKRTPEENTRFIELLVAAEDNLSQALSCISYSSFPKVNKEVITKLQNIIGNISRIEYNISIDPTSLLKPVKVVNEVKYYELYYFHGRKDTGSIYVKTELNKEDYDDEDAFLLELVNRKELDASEVNNITIVNEIDKKTYCDMTSN